MSDPQRYTDEAKEAVSACRKIFGVSERIARAILPELEIEDVSIACSMANLQTGWSIVSLFKSSAKLKDKSDVEQCGLILTDFVKLRKTRLEDLTRAEANAPGHFWRKDVPREVLRFGAYLYYRGLISSETLEAALEWQRQSRPLMGQVAMREKMLSPQSFARVLAERQECGQMFGMVARKLDLLREVGIDEIALIQRRYDCPIGRYFVEKGILDAMGVEERHREMQAHNRRFGS